MKNNIKYFVDQYKEHREWKKDQKSKTIDLNDYFKYSGKIERSKSMYNFASYRGKWAYDENSRCYTLHEIITKKNNNEENKENTSEFVEATSADTWG